MLYALEPFQGGLLVTDGHHNRVLQVTLDGQITELAAFANVVPTGLAVSGDTVYIGRGLLMSAFSGTYLPERFAALI